MILWGETPKERAAETGMPMCTIDYKSNLFDQAGMASFLPPDPPPVVPKRDKRTPPDIQQEIINLHAEYPAFRSHELATMCYVKFGRKPSPQTIKLTLATGPKPTRSRRFQRWAEIADSLFASWICTEFRTVSPEGG